jgi:hypothetical protein
MLFLRSLVFQILFWANTILLMVIWLPGLVMPRRVSQERVHS